ncbi:MAG: hypothetical protein QOE03_3329 [Micromonosporaceae bacterium]|nr:hypothetical protein [Micromonosporaceae bacterium]
MNTILEPPAERELHPRRRAEMRARLLWAMAPGANTRTPHRPRRRLALAAAGLAVTAGIATFVAVDPLGDGGNTETLAYSGGAVPPDIRRAADECLADSRAIDDDPAISDAARGGRVGANLELVNFLGRRGDVAVVFTAGTATVYCFNQPARGGRSASHVAASNWLPGPVVIEGGSSTEAEGPSDRFALAGRVSPRVGRVVLDHGNGRTTPANLAGGTFTLISDGTVEVGSSVLVTYDRAGTVIDRRPAWPDLTRQTSTCYTDPAGGVVAGSIPGADCRPAEAWR